MRTNQKVPLGAIAVALTFALMGCAGEPVTEQPTTEAKTTDVPAVTEPTTEAPATIKLYGAIGITAKWTIELAQEDRKCSGHSEYSSIKEDVQAKVFDSTGAIVGTASLGPAFFHEDSGGCIWYFDVEVPEGGKFYSAQVLDWVSDAVPEEDFPNATLAILPTL